ncbi:MAG: Rpn family recombination-promoting nuclease/putative transposase [SAR324 cluster bacterium]|nr:Rpn family recombination-promoting nuclease/putative transposase [SAR324 cluster bacterium]
MGDPKHQNILTHFLNSILKPQSPLHSVEILNPYNDKEFVGDKQTIVDVKARDEDGKTYQIEIQLTLSPALSARILYNWSVLYKSLIHSGEDFPQLKPVISIWLLASSLLENSTEFHHHFELWDVKHQLRLIDHCSIHLIELSKWKNITPPLDAEQAWLYFFDSAKNWDELPPELQNIDALRSAMEVLQRFSEQERDYLLYEARLDAIRDERARNKLYETTAKQLAEALQRETVAQKREEEAQKREALAQKREALAQKREEEAQKREEEERKQKEHFLELLKKAGIDPTQ